tara:strand:+ start:2437 stop:4458 length:2022 start_codon:yes stop_codon:yes gene_type:complete
MMRAVLTLALVAVSEASEVYTIGQVRSVSSNDPADGDTDSRDVTIVDNGNCFIYTSENTYGHANLSYEDWRTWKTCGVFNGQTLTHTLISDPAQPEDTDYSFPQASGDASVACLYEAKLEGESTKDIIMAVGGTFTPLTSNPDGGDRGCDVSYDGSTVVYAEEDSNEVLQAYQYNREAGTSTLMSANPGNLRAKWPRTSADGSRTVFVSQNAVHDPLLTTSSSGSTFDEAWLFRQGDDPVRIANLASQQCNRTFMYELIVADWGAEAVVAEGLSGGSSLGNGGTPCQYYASKGVTAGAGTISLGDNGASIDGNGRFVVYGANYDLSTIRGTHESKSTVSARNLFLFDASLGLTWQITKEGDESQLESFCCPAASSSKQRGACTVKNEMKGFCCWQRPCGHPTVDQRISTDGNSIVFWGDGYPDASHTNMDYDVFHYYIPTSLTTVVTRTANKNYDEQWGDVSAGGDVVAWTSDYDFETAESITGTNQIFASKLALGCSRNAEALNYIASPDVEVCCEYANVEVQPGASCHSVRLKFHGDADAMYRSVPFHSDDQDGLCSRYAAAVRADVACSLAIPSGLIEVVTDSCASWGANGIEVDVSFFSDAAEGASELLAQIADPSSRIWSGYITKTLRDEGHSAAAPCCPAGCVAASSRRKLLFASTPTCPAGCVPAA